MESGRLANGLGFHLCSPHHEVWAYAGIYLQAQWAKDKKCKWITIADFHILEVCTAILKAVQEGVANGGAKNNIKKGWIRVNCFREKDIENKKEIQWIGYGKPCHSLVKKDTISISIESIKVGKTA
jgi:hypothetical protein